MFWLRSYSANDVNVERPRKEKVLKATDLEEVDEDDPVSDHEFDEEKVSSYQLANLGTGCLSLSLRVKFKHASK